MKKQHVVTVDEMKKLDLATAKAKKMTFYQLMFYAGEQISEQMKTIQTCSIADDIIILAGPGNNGGDALVVAEKLIKDNYRVKIYLVISNHKQTLENKQQVEHLTKIGIEITDLNANNLNIFNHQLKKSTCLIDGLLGIGYKSPMEPLFHDIIKCVNSANLNIISIDVPSGLNAHNGLVEDIAIHANHTMIIGQYKVGNLIQDALDYQGKTHLIDIGIIDLDLRKRFIINQNDKLDYYSPRKHHTHKYDYGHIIIIGGSIGMLGAPILTAHAALRSGSGLVTVLIPEKDFPFVNSPLPEIMIKPLNQAENLENIVDNKKTIVYGVGLGKAKDDQMIDFIVKNKIPSVIDADGISHLKKHINSNHKLSHIIMTPHLGELSNLLDLNSKICQKDILNHIENLATNTKMTICFKGPCTIIANASETIFAQLGNPGLATAGSGDVLTGIIASFLAHKNSPIQAALKGAHLHGLTANLASKTYGETALIASDIINHLHLVIQ
jgi:ADP-dependent NAD(P)H-hydrate dehydratase / NAD(P)H-hydrate epimerase